MGFLSKTFGKSYKTKFKKGALGFAGGFATTGGNWFLSGVGGVAAASSKGKAGLKSVLTGGAAGFGTSAVLGALGAGAGGVGIFGKTAGLYKNVGMTAGSKLADFFKSKGGAKVTDSLLGNIGGGGEAQGPVFIPGPNGHQRVSRGGEAATKQSDWLPIAAVAGGALLLL